MQCIRLPLKGAINTRDLGGYCTKDGKVTKFNVFVRSNRLTELTYEDNEFLRKYNITDIIDLRGNTNIQSSFISDDNINKDYFNLHYIPLSNIEIEQYVKENSQTKEFNYGIGYSYLLKNKEKIKKIFKVLINSEGGVLFHCSAGKDRTGVIAALILGICNVNQLDIIANYQVTSTYMKDEEIMKGYDDNLQKSDANYMDTFIKILYKQYGSFENYLLSCDILKEEINRLKNKFCEKI
ncbi:MAG: tyrosine-protein phosphatase [Clostridia bacterium]